MGRHANPDIKRAFAEYQDADTPSKCNKVRCLHCGFVRAKNTTRQIEHLQECQAYLQSPDAQLHLQSQESRVNSMANEGSEQNAGMLNGSHPNPNLQIHRRGPNQTKRGRESIAPAPVAPAPTQFVPSLTAHLLNVAQQPFNSATQQPFLSHAGCGTLSAGALSQWMVQDAHYARGYIIFLGQLLAKLRLPVVPNSQFHPMYRTMDLLIAALNNIRREMNFFDITAAKYGLQLTDEAPNHITRSYLDLFANASSASASLLEGMVVLWATEHCYRTAWMYAANFSHSLSTPSQESHIVALHQALIPNWTSPNFHKFVDACKALVDELANTTSTPNGKEEMQRCEQIFRHVCWLEERFWPDVDGMGEEDESGRLATSHNTMSSASIGPMGQNMAQGLDSSDDNQYRGVLNGVTEAAAGTSS
ncbi:hypothetical protein BDY21DRAFT_101877 [Lineolata rhizophorae]|uniref:Thiaminase-2/PQQC domain-containing protein n=1 Tax=Lineolata rhizophorae TaxID=578093 RepID=A0A6A6NSN6_9PEZI|nr:hypothetical protein BDY21DRAFT_101877 [Lineolata rhizophorae]